MFLQSQLVNVAILACEKFKNVTVIVVDTENAVSPSNFLMSPIVNNFFFFLQSNAITKDKSCNTIGTCIQEDQDSNIFFLILFVAACVLDNAQFKSFF